MAMSAAYDDLPLGFLRMGRRSFEKLNSGVRTVIVALAKEHNYKCAFCTCDHKLEVEHDHDPDEGSGDEYTIYNIRGLVCRGCHFHLTLYERLEQGDSMGWDHVDCRIDWQEYKDYIYFYTTRTDPLLNSLHVKRVGCSNPEHREIVLRKFDAWKYDEEPSPWRERWERDRAPRIETPEEAIRGLLACLRYAKAEADKDPNGQLPAELIEPLVRLWPIVESLAAIARERTSIAGASEGAGG
jgi:hypothetical protein